MYIVVCIDSPICIILACDVYLPDLQVLKISDLGQAKPSQRHGKPSELSLTMRLRGNLEQSTFGKRPGWTHSQQCQGHLSCSIMFKSADID
jgi:hypothetical protein